MCTFALTDSATLPEEQRTRAELLHLYLMTKYTNRALEIQQQIGRLEENGLIISNKEHAVSVLSIISYFRLANYWRPMEVDKVNHLFKPNSTFDNALSLYYFDKELRTLIFSAIQSIEIALRTKVIHHFSLSHGPFWFMNEELTKSGKKQQENLQNLKKELSRSKEDFIKEHYHKYTSPSMPPAWKTLEVASFGILSKLYGNFKDITNTQVDTGKLYVLLCCVVYWLNNIYPNNNFVIKFKQLLGEYPNVDIAAMGFPVNWKDEPLRKHNGE